MIKPKPKSEKNTKQKKLNIEDEARSLNVSSGFHRAVVHLLKVKPLKKR
jgi:hypothetical protein